MKVVKLQDAWDKLHSVWRPQLRSEHVKLLDALSRVLAIDVEAPIDLPPFDRSAVDGYAVKAEETFGADEENPKEFKVVFKVSIGTVPKARLNAGEAAYVSTGCFLPEGSDAVVMVEYTHVEWDRLKVYKPLMPNENVFRKGGDVRKGSLLLRRGARLTSRRLGLLASVGISKVPVYVKPKVAVMSTGSELIEPGRRMEEGKVYDVNATSIAAMVMEAGAEAKVLGIVSDSVEEVARRVDEGARLYDLFLTSGGTSKGDVDVLAKALSSIDESRIIAHGLALKPGKPTLIALVRDKPVVGLPGNPTSAMLVFQVFVKPLLQEMVGLVEDDDRFIEAKLAVKMASDRGRREFKFVKLEVGDDGLFARPLPTGSEAVTTYGLADGYIEILEEVEIVEEGEVVRVRLLK